MKDKKDTKQKRISSFFTQLNEKKNDESQRNLSSLNSCCKTSENLEKSNSDDRCSNNQIKSSKPSIKKVKSENFKKRDLTEKFSSDSKRTLLELKEPDLKVDLSSEFQSQGSNLPSSDEDFKKSGNYSKKWTKLKARDELESSCENKNNPKSSIHESVQQSFKCDKKIEEAIKIEFGNEEMHDLFDDDSNELFKICNSTEVKPYLDFDVDFKHGSKSENKNLLSKFNRYLVVSVTYKKPQEVAVIIRDESGCTKTCVLKGFWMDTILRGDDVVHIEGDFINDEVIIDDNNGIIVVNPDHLISGTSVVAMLFCPRKTVLNEKFRGVDPGNVHMLYGSFVHQIFQKIVCEKIKTLHQMKKLTRDILKENKNLHEMYASNLCEKEVLDHIEKVLPNICSWANKYLVTNDTWDREKLFHVDDVIDIEENYWCPQYGLKGKVDLTLNVRNCSKSSKNVIPLELKTGRSSFSAEHQGQITLYNMMMKDRHPNSSHGYLLYLSDEVKMKQVTLTHQCKSGLIQRRNELMSYVTTKLSNLIDNNGNVDETSYSLPSLPEPLNNKRLCSKCPQLINCSLYQTRIEKMKLSNNHALHSLSHDALQHLSSSEMDFFHHWCLLIHLEMDINRKESSIKNIWLSPAEEMENRGNCFASMVLCGSPQILGQEQYLHTFVKQNKDYRNLSSLLDVGFSLSDPCIVSNQMTLDIAISSGIIYEIKSSQIKIVLDRNLYRSDESGKIVYRIDRNDSFSTHVLNLSNLSLLMAPENSVLRHFIVENAVPNFKHTLSKELALKGKPIFRKLNKPQQKAIFKTLMCEDYILIKGMPGTGKTSTIVALIQILLLVGKTVLVTAYTHSAVDNILNKLKIVGVTNFVRLGKLSRIHKDIRPYSSEILTKDITSVQELENFYKSKPVIAASCLGINHALFRRHKFDICIVDEASQVILPSCLGPLYMAKKFVLVGDPKQLPPVVKNKVAEKLGMNKSLFSYLENDVSTVNLNLQYRMNEEIMRISNELTYDGCLRCGDESTKNAILKLSAQSHDESWIDSCFEQTMSKSVLFLNTDSIPLPQIKDPQGFIYNSGEAKIVRKLCHILKKNGVAEDSIGIVTPYRRQVKFIEDRLKQSDLNNVEVNTVDQYQGREKLVIVMSCVKTSYHEGSNIGILHDPRRLNVAITRAKVKLIVIGSKSTLACFPSFDMFLNKISADQIITLPSI